MLVVRASYTDSLTSPQNDYSWCNTDIQISDWDQKVKNFTDYGLPIL